MPSIFSKSQKITIVQYGVHSSEKISIKKATKEIMGTIRKVLRAA